jgi:hypothetical protein
MPSRRPKKKKIPVVVRLDGAREVILTGDFTGWAVDQIRLAPAGPGEWTAQLELTPGEYQYRLIVDGRWADDPASPRRVPNPYGSENAILTVA